MLALSMGREVVNSGGAGKATAGDHTENRHV